MSDRIKVKPLHKLSEITIQWKLISRGFKDEGRLKLVLTPTITPIYKTVVTPNPKMKVEEGEIEDYIETIKDKD